MIVFSFFKGVSEILIYNIQIFDRRRATYIIIPHLNINPVNEHEKSNLYENS